MLNRRLLDDKLNQIRSSANRLAKMREMSRDEFLAEPDNFAVAEHHLRRSLEALFDIGRHIAAKKGLGKPESYKEIIDLLGQNGVLSSEFSRSIIGMAGYRNRLVHGYVHITPEEIFDLIQTKLNDFALFCAAVIRFMEKEAESRPEHS